METGHSVRAASGQAGPGGASTSVINMGGGMDAPKTLNTPDEGLAEQMPKAEEKVTAAQAVKNGREVERKQLESLLQELREAIDKSLAMEPFKDQLLLDITPEGL